jgi:hypothetical protein
MIITISDGQNVGAVLSVIHIKDDVCLIGTHVLATYLKHKQKNPAATHLIPLYSTGLNDEQLDRT